MKKKIAVLISGRGSNMLSIAKAVDSGQIPAEITLVFSNKKKAVGFEKAAEMDIETLAFSHKQYKTREDFDHAVVAELDKRGIDLVCLAGYMRLLSPWFCKKYFNRIMNIHPSILPAFPGIDAQEQAVEWGAKVSGCTVHFVDEKLDHGPIILQESIKVDPEDTGETLSEKILKLEHKLYPKAVELFCKDRLTINGRKVLIGD